MDNEQNYYGDKRIINVMLVYNKKQLKQAIEDGNEKKIHKLESNIKHYENELKKLEKGV